MYSDAYVDAVPESRIDAALTLALRLHRNQPSWDLVRCAQLAVQHVFCPCVTGVAFTAEPGLGALQEAVIDEILRQVRARLASAAAPSAPGR
jgi:hypothetical protein